MRTKILWVARPQAQVGTQAGVDGLRLHGELAGTSTVIDREVPGGPGPSGINFPEEGCWLITGRWATSVETLAVPVGPSAATQSDGG